MIKSFLVTIEVTSNTAPFERLEAFANGCKGRLMDSISVRRGDIEAHITQVKEASLKVREERKTVKEYKREIDVLHQILAQEMERAEFFKNNLELVMAGKKPLPWRPKKTTETKKTTRRRRTRPSTRRATLYKKADKKQENHDKEKSRSRMKLE